MVEGLKRMARTQRGILVGLAVLVGFAIAVPMTSGAAAAPYSHAGLNCRPAPRAVGGRSRAHTVIVVGSRFPASTAVKLSFDRTRVVGSATTNSTGSFTTRVRIPATHAGRHTVTATAAKGAASAICRV